MFGLSRVRIEPLPPGDWRRARRMLAYCAALVLVAMQMVPPPVCAQANAEQTAAEFTPRMKVRVRAFGNGMRATGMNVAPDRTAAPIDQPRIEADYPDWLKRDELLGELPAGEIGIRLSWRIEQGATPLPDSPHYALKLANHQGYATLTQRNDRTALDLAGRSPGSMLWSDHAFAPLNAFPPGLYNALLSSTIVPRESIPLGQLLWVGQPVSREVTLAQVREMYPDGAAAFAGLAVLARWHRFELPVRGVTFVPRTLVIVNSADWLEGGADMTPVAEIGLSRAGKKIGRKELDLGRDTSSTWFSFHARGSVKHSQAPIAWSWRERQESVDFEASAYAARFDLTEINETPDALTVRFIGDEGVLRIYAVVLLP